MRMSDDWMRKNYPELVSFLEKETDKDDDLEEALAIVDSFAGIMDRLNELNNRAKKLKV